MYTPRLESSSHLPTSDRLEFFARLYAALQALRDITENASSSCMNSSGVTSVKTSCWRDGMGVRRSAWHLFVRRSLLERSVQTSSSLSQAKKLGGLESAARLR